MDNVEHLCLTLLILLILGTNQGYGSICSCHQSYEGALECTINEITIERIIDDATRKYLRPGSLHGMKHNCTDVIINEIVFLKNMLLNMERRLSRLIHPSDEHHWIKNDPSHQILSKRFIESKHHKKPNDIDEEEESSGSVLDGMRNLRQNEVDQLNNTITSKAGKSMFRYYWKISDIAYKISEWNEDSFERSEDFFVLPNYYKMYIKAYPHDESGNLQIRIGLTQGEYDDQLHWPFTLNFRISILDYSPRKEDISSRIWNPKELCSEWNWQRPEKRDNFECVRLGIPHDLLQENTYIFKDSITVRLTVFI